MKNLVEERNGKMYVNGKYLADVREELPEGWRYIKGALTAPLGYEWAWNVKSHFGGECKQWLVRVVQTA